MSDYAAFLDGKRQGGADSGFAPTYMPEFLFDFQKTLVDWAVRKGRSAIFADCGLGKTPMQLVWAENIVRNAGRVLILAPLAVSAQTIREAQKFGINAGISRDGNSTHDITVTNYQRLHYFRPEDFRGVVCDESSILKSFDGATRNAITVFMRKVPYRLLCTATAAPNDYIELGTSSEALGYLRHSEMLPMYFKHDGGDTQKWHLKGHGVVPFWRWVCSWARACRRPSDLGFDDRRFVLPALVEHEHMLKVTTPPEGMLFALPARTLQEQREERRRTIGERCENIAAIVNGTGKPALVWCHLNAEGDLLERLIPDAVQVAGKDTDEAKEERLLAFADNKIRVLVTKPRIGAWGMNFQHCSHVTFFPSHSFEQYYQGVRRCWRFGQESDVVVDIVTTEGERGVLNNLQRKSRKADQMFSHLVAEMSSAIAAPGNMDFTLKEEIPAWLL